MRDPLCQAIFNKLKKANDAYELLMNTGEEAVPFQGDAFGTAEDYAGDMFGQLGDDHNENMDTRDSGPDDRPPALSELSDDEDEDDDDDDDEAHMVAELEKSWEPHRDGTPHLEVEDDHNMDGPGNVEVQPNLEEEEEDGADSEGAQQRNIGWFIIGDGYGIKPTVRIQSTNKYPNARAGQPLSCEETHDSGYASALGGGDNPWALFNLKKDWEIEKWAKLRGVRSTAFSELLAIDGVCLNCIFLPTLMILIFI